MTEYVCKYAPVELLAGFGEEASLINAAVRNFDAADTVVHKNMCGFSRALVEYMMGKSDDALVLTDCCDSIRRSRDALAGKGKKVFFLHLPHKDEPFARQLYKSELLRWIDEFAAYSGKTFDYGKFRNAIMRKSEGPPETSGPHITLLGARMSDELLGYIKAISPLPILNNTCTGNRLVGSIPPPIRTDELMDWYVGELLSQPPCMRMADVRARKVLCSDEQMVGAVYCTVGFCDYYACEYAEWKKELSVPMVKIETDYSTQAVAQLRNRLDAFFEQVSGKSADFLPRTGRTTGRNRWYVAGIDSGSTSTDAVILDEDRKIVSFAVLPTGVRMAENARRSFDIAVEKAGLSKEQVRHTVSTGYGRTGIGIGNKDVTEITCHAKGAYFLNPQVRTVIDIGGQDSKVIRLDGNGAVRDFSMNDKCAAGTGRFLEMMAQSLGISLDEMSSCSLQWNEEITISSMCSVFAQSEVVNLIAAGRELPDIVHALNVSVAARVIALGGRTGMEAEFMMTGGVARNAGVVRAIEEKLGCRVSLPEDPEICGALGAALIAWEAEA